jgi:hypothetical protein
MKGPQVDVDLISFYKVVSELQKAKLISNDTYVLAMVGFAICARLELIVQAMTQPNIIIPRG